MITAIVGFFYWLGNQGQLDLWTCSPLVAWIMCVVFVVEVFATFAFLEGTS